MEVPVQATSNLEGQGLTMEELTWAITVKVLSTINPDVSAECPFCNHREMVVHCLREDEEKSLEVC